MPPADRLARSLNLPGATLIGLGSIIGTGAFVAIPLVASEAGRLALPAIAIAALVALVNALSSAQLAAAHPVSGGTYEYAWRFVAPPFGFTAGLAFLLAKSASAAAGALACSAYIARLLVPITGPPGQLLVTAGALGIIALLTALVLSGIRRSALANALIVSIAIGALLLFSLLALSLEPLRASDHSPGANTTDLLAASALIFVAFTGYGRIATLGEEVRRPRRTIPRAIIASLLFIAILYALVCLAALRAAPLDDPAVIRRGDALPLGARELAGPWLQYTLIAAGLAAMLGVILNLILGLSRVVLAMARRRDLPHALSTLTTGREPARAVILCALAIGALCLFGDIRTAWSFSAFTVLIYYAITNLAALRLPRERRFVPRAVPALGVLLCLSLAFFIDRRTMLAGAVLLAAGLAFRAIARRRARARES